MIIDSTNLVLILKQNPIKFSPQLYIFYKFNITSQKLKFLKNKKIYLKVNFFYIKTHTKL